MKNIFYLLLVVLVLCSGLSLSACSNDNSGKHRVSGGVSSVYTGGNGGAQVHTGISF